MKSSKKSLDDDVVDEDVVLLAHYYNGQQIKQEPECDFQRFTTRQDALDFPCKNNKGEGEDDEVVVLAHYYNGQQIKGLAPVLEETPIDDKEEVVVLAHYQ